MGSSLKQRVGVSAFVHTRTFFRLRRNYLTKRKKTLSFQNGRSHTKSSPRCSRITEIPTPSWKFSTSFDLREAKKKFSKTKGRKSKMKNAAPAKLLARCQRARHFWHWPEVVRMDPSEDWIEECSVHFPRICAKSKSDEEKYPSYDIWPKCWCTHGR